MTSHPSSLGPGASPFVIVRGLRTALRTFRAFPSQGVTARFSYRAESGEISTPWRALWVFLEFTIPLLSSFSSWPSSSFLSPLLFFFTARRNNGDAQPLCSTGSFINIVPTFSAAPASRWLLASSLPSAQWQCLCSSPLPQTLGAGWGGGAQSRKLWPLHSQALLKGAS